MHFVYNVRWLFRHACPDQCTSVSCVPSKIPPRSVKHINANCNSNIDNMHRKIISFFDRLLFAIMQIKQYMYSSDEHDTFTTYCRRPDDIRQCLRCSSRQSTNMQVLYTTNEFDRSKCK